MKTIILQGISQYDVLTRTSEIFANEMNKYGIDTVVANLSNINKKQYLNLVEKFDPDFTVGLNPVTILYGNDNHHEYTKIPHIVRFADHPYYHVGNRSLSNPNAKTVFSIAPQSIYQAALEKLKVENYEMYEVPHGKELFYSDYYSKIYPVTFFGSIKNPSEDIDYIIQKNEVDSTVSKILIDFTKQLVDILNSTGKFLEDSVEIYFENFLKVNYKLSDNEIINISKKLFFVIDSYYRNLMRISILQEFAETGIEMYIFSKGNVAKEYFSKYSNVTIKNEVSYFECINIISQSKVCLNISPMFKSTHERVINSLYNSTIFCSNEMVDMQSAFGELNEIGYFYNMNNISEIAEQLKVVMMNEKLYNEKVQNGKEFAKKNFTYNGVIENMVGIYNRYFKI